MSDYVVEPQPGVTLSNANEYGLPITSFDLVMIVEPDPESYIPLPGDLEKLGELLYGMFVQFVAEFDPDRPAANRSIQPYEGKVTNLIWLKYEDEKVNYFDRFVDVALARVSFNLFDSEDMEHVEYYLKGLADYHPNWQVAVIGAMFEDEVIYTANVIHQIGFSTTVLSRYCLSNKVFVNLDNLFEHDRWVRTADLREGESYHSWFEEWMQDHDIYIDDCGDEDQDDEED